MPALFILTLILAWSNPLRSLGYGRGFFTDRSRNTIVKSADFTYEIEDLIRNSVESFAARSPLLQSLVSPVNSTLLADETPVFDVESEFNRLSFRNDETLGVEVYNMLLKAWLRSGRSDAGLKCEEIVQRMQYAGIDPNADTYSTLVAVWSALPGVDAVSNAYEYYRQSLYCTLDSSAYEALIASVDSNIDADDNAFAMVSSIFSRMRQANITSQLQESTCVTYANMLLKSAPAPVSAMEALLAEQRHSVLQQYLLRALCLEASDAAQLRRAQTLVEALHEQGPLLEIVYAEYSQAWTHQRGSAEDLVDVLTAAARRWGVRSALPWNILLETFMTNITTASAIQASAVLQLMLDLDVDCDSSTFEAVILIWCDPLLNNAGDARRLLDILDRRGGSPTFATFRALILLLLRTPGVPRVEVDQLFMRACGQSEYLSRCPALLQEMMTTTYALPFACFKEFLRLLSIFEDRSNAESAILLFKTMERRDAECRADLQCFEYLFRTFERSSSLSHAENAWNALRYMGSLEVAPSLHVFESLLRTWVNSRRHDSPSRCMQILEMMKAQGVAPTTVVFNIVLKAWSRSALPAAGDKAMDLLELMDTSNGSAEPNSETFALIAYAVSKSTVYRLNAKPLEQIETLYRRLCGYIKTHATDVQNSASLESMHRSLINIWSHNRSVECQDKMSALLEAMSIHGLAPHPSVYAKVQSAWGLESVHRSRTLLNRLLDRNVRGERLAIAYNMLLTSGKRSVSVSAAETLFAAMASEFTPDVTSYNILLEAIGRNQNSKDWLKRTDAVLGAMQVAPNDYTLSVMTRLWSGGKLAPKEVAMKVDALFRRILVPALSSYSLLISVWCRVDANRASALIDKMISAEGVTEPSLYASLIDAVARSKQAVLADKLLRSLISSGASAKPDILSVRLVLEAWANSGLKAAGERAQDILDVVLQLGVALDSEMFCHATTAWARQGESLELSRADRLFTKAKQENVRVNGASLKNMILIYGRMRDCAEKAEAVLLQMSSDGHNDELDLLCFNVVIEAWGKSNWRDAGSRAEALLDRMSELNILPDVITYTSLMSALAKKPSVESASKAELYFNQMRAEGILPDSRAYATLLSIWSKVKDTGAETKVRELFDEMVVSGVAPTIVIYTAMLSMYGNSKDPSAGSHIFQIFERIKTERLRLDAAGYSSLLSAIGRSMDEGAPHQAESVFEEMLDAGVPPDTTAWNILLSIWARSKLPERFAKVEQFYEQMLESACVPNEYLVTTLLKMWSFSGHPEAKSKIMAIYEYLLESKIVLDGYAIKVLIQALLKAMSPAAAIEKVEKLLQHMLDFGVVPESACFSVTIKSDFSNRAYERGLRFIGMIKDAGRRPSKEIYRATIAAIEKLREPSKRELAIQDALCVEVQNIA